MCWMIPVKEQIITNLDWEQKNFITRQNAATIQRANVDLGSLHLKLWHAILNSTKKWFGKDETMSDNIKVCMDYTYSRGDVYFEGQEIRVVRLAKAFHNIEKKLELCLPAASTSMEFLQAVVIPMLDQMNGARRMSGIAHPPPRGPGAPAPRLDRRLRPMRALSSGACKTFSPALSVTAGGHNSFNLANAALDDPEGDNIEEDILTTSPSLLMMHSLMTKI